MDPLNDNSKLLRIFIGDADKLNHTPLYEAILIEARKTGMAGATVSRGIMSFGSTSKLHTVKLLDLSADLPVIVEIIDHEDKISAFIKVVGGMIEESGCGGL